MSPTQPTQQLAKRQRWSGPPVRSLLAWVLLSISLQTGFTIFSVHVLSSVRAFVGGESFWSKAQKDAVLAIGIYAQTGDPAALASFRQAIEVVEADKQARLAMERVPPDVAAATAALLRAETDPNDVAGMLWLYRYFFEVGPIEKAVHHWRRGDELVQRLTELSVRLETRLKSGPIDEVELKDWNARIIAINDELRPESAAFAYRLGDASRWVTGLLAVANGAVALLFGTLLVWRFLALERAMSKRPTDAFAPSHGDERAATLNSGP